MSEKLWDQDSRTTLIISRHRYAIMFKFNYKNIFFSNLISYDIKERFSDLAIFA